MPLTVRKFLNTDFRRNPLTLETCPTSPYLCDNFAPVREEVTADNLPVIGELPQDLDGMFIRNGPNPQFDPLGRYHWFDGDGMLHGVRIANGSASYRNRYVRTKGWELEREAGRALFTGLLEPPRFDNPHGPFKNAANTALVWHDGRLLALWEGGEPHHIRVPGLETVGPYTYCGKLLHAFTAHPKVDAQTGELFFFGYNVIRPPYLQYSVVSAAGEIVHTTPIELPIGVMMHDFAITERFAIFMNHPYTFSLERALRGEPIAKWEPDRGSHFGIMPRYGSGSEVRWFSTDPCYVFHVLNAFEEGDEVVLDACRLPSVDLAELGDEEEPVAARERQLSSQAKNHLHRWRFDLMTGAVRQEPLDDTDTDFPRINEALVGRANRYGYTARFVRDRWGRPLADALVKYDLATGRSIPHPFGRGRSGGEGVFVPRPRARSEDDGYVMTFVYDDREGTSELVILDAQNFDAPPVARVILPQRVPYGFHGAWVGAAQMASQREA
jgi:carotenoid cleavage dioxygenase-like enzyme